MFKKSDSKEFRYSLSHINRELSEHYKKADYGLLACEPNWVFPLCNSITATGLRALDTQTGSSDWESIADRFKQSLQSEFTSGCGLLVPFRSSRTGIAAPLIGGGAMQSLLVIGLVLTAEGLNTAIEKACDEISLEYRERIKTAKDVAAGAVLLSSITAAIIGVQTFLPYVSDNAAFCG